jgi:glutathione-regulated potassium-efflux system ancillary protein KefG
VVVFTPPFDYPRGDGCDFGNNFFWHFGGTPCRAKRKAGLSPLIPSTLNTLASPCPFPIVPYPPPVPARVLVLFAHPALQKSRIHRHLAASARGVEGITFHDLYEVYPDLQIDIEREQARLLAHDVIVFQHPFYWYSCPAILKEWLDVVLEHGFAYGQGGDKLRGKKLISALSTGGGEHAYTREGHNHFTMRELLAPFEQTARLCGMTWLDPFVVHGTIRLTEESAIAAHAAAYARLLARLRDDPHPSPSR